MNLKTTDAFGNRIKADGDLKFQHLPKSNLKLTTYHLQLPPDTCGKRVETDGENESSNYHGINLKLTTYNLLLH